jgi:hypothetical protein
VSGGESAPMFAQRNVAQRCASAESLPVQVRWDVAQPGEVIIPHQTPMRLATHVRSTLLQSSLATLRMRGHMERYLQLVDPVYRDEIIGSIAPGWLPIALGDAHYRACDALELGNDELLEIGEAVGDRMQGPYMDTLTRTARNLGVTPWLLLKRFDALWGRLFQGGSFELTKVGPKDLTIEIRGARLSSSSYFRRGFCGVVRAGYKYVGVRAAYVKIGGWDPRSDRFVMSAAWA